MGLGGRPLPAPPPNAAERAGESNTEWILGVTGLFCSLALIAIGLRTYVRAVISKLVGWDDYTMLLAGLTSLAAMICFGVEGKYGLGKHYEARTQHDDTQLQFVGFIQANIGLIPGLAILKISIGLSLLRLSRTLWYSYVLYGLLAFVVFSELFGSFTIIFFCNPVRQYWDGSANGKCYPVTLFVNFGVIHTAFNIFSDVAFATTPIPIIWNLQMKTRTRLYLIGVFSLGYVYRPKSNYSQIVTSQLTESDLRAVIMGVIRAVYQISFGADPDSAFYQRVQFWGYLQLNTGIIAACAPTLKPLVGRWLNISSSNGYSSNFYGNASSGQARRRTGYIVQNTPVIPDYELDDREQNLVRDTSDYHASIKGGHLSSDTYDKTGSLGERSGSEEMILPIPGTSKGIVRTTEVAIQRQEGV